MEPFAHVGVDAVASFPIVLRWDTWSTTPITRSAQPGGGASMPRAWREDAEPEEDPSGGRSWFTPVIVGGVGLVLLFAIGIGLWLISRNPDGAAPPQASATATAAAPTSAPAPTS